MHSTFDDSDELDFCVWSDPGIEGHNITDVFTTIKLTTVLLVGKTIGRSTYNFCSLLSNISCYYSFLRIYCYAKAIGTDSGLFSGTRN